MLAGLVHTPFAHIIMRSLFNVPMAGAEEMARYMLICWAFLAAAIVSLYGGQIKMEELQAMLPFYVPLLATLLLITYVPWITTFIPRLVLGDRTGMRQCPQRERSA